MVGVDVLGMGKLMSSGFGWICRGGSIEDLANPAVASYAPEAPGTHGGISGILPLPSTVSSIADSTAGFVSEVVGGGKGTRLCCGGSVVAHVVNGLGLWRLAGRIVIIVEASSCVGWILWEVNRWLMG